MEYTIPAKPTIYKGTKFRSRLEARWAAFFDLIGWRYQYEPFDLNGWTPDFQVFGRDGRSILLEVKPYIDMDIRTSYFIKITNALNIRGETEFDLSPVCILACEPVKAEYSNWYVSAGYQISPWGTFEVQWKDDIVADIHSKYDIGSLLMNYNGLLWNRDKNRKIFLPSHGPAYEEFIGKWVEAGENSRFHYDG
jgi:hypothetical protein